MPPWIKATSPAEHNKVLPNDRSAETNDEGDPRRTTTRRSPMAHSLTDGSADADGSPTQRRRAQRAAIAGGVGTLIGLASLAGMARSAKLRRSSAHPRYGEASTIAAANAE